MSLDSPSKAPDIINPAANSNDSSFQHLSSSSPSSSSSSRSDYRHDESQLNHAENTGSKQLLNRIFSNTLGSQTMEFSRESVVTTKEDYGEHEERPLYIHSMLAGGIGGSSGDMLMHSLDTVKTRQQGDPHFPPKYGSTSASYLKIFREEGFRRGLYSGVSPALMGSFPGTVIFFGMYEWSKRHMLDGGLNATLSYLSAGFVADLAASVVYVPSEVLKTRLQLQGRYNNPYFNSGYNYRSTPDAFRTIVRTEGVRAMFSGYRATLFRDLPFSALQFAFYEQEQEWAKRWTGRKDIGLPLEVLTATTAGGMAGVLTCPLDVVKTRIQTQQNPDSKPSLSSSSSTEHMLKKDSRPQAQHQQQHQTATPSASSSKTHSRPISTSSPSTTTPQPGAPVLHTSSVFTGLRLIYKAEGFGGWFRGVGPRAVWTSVQSGTMLVMYQYLLKKLEAMQQSAESAPVI